MRVLSAYRRTAAVGVGMFVSFSCWVALDQPPGTKKWDFFTGAAIQSSAAIAPNGMVYFGTDSGKLYAFYPDGRGQWEFPTGDRIVASPTIGADGTVYFGGYNGIFYAIAPEGVERWRFRANGPIASSAAIGPDGTICFGTLNNRLFALRPDGSKVWDLAASDAVVGSPAIDQNGVLYTPSADGVLAAIDLRTGDVKWEFESPNRILSSPAIAADGTIYFGCFDGHVYALDRWGKKKWTFATGGPVRGSPAIGPDGTIYVGSDDRQLYALAPDGFKKWTFTMGKWIRSTPSITRDGTIYVGSYDHSLYAVSPVGAKKWEFVTDHNITASAAVGTDGTVFIGSWNGRFYALRGSSPLAEGHWPRFRGDSRQTGFLSPTVVPEPPPVVAKKSEPKPEESAPVILVKQEPGSVLGNWWRRQRSNSKSESKSETEVRPAMETPETKVVAQVSEPVPTVIESRTTTVVEAVKPEAPKTSSAIGAMVPVWEPAPRRSAPEAAMAAPAAAVEVATTTTIAEPVPTITAKQEKGSVLGNWWKRQRTKTAAPNEPPTFPAAVPLVDTETTTVTTTTVVGTPAPQAMVMTNELSAAREQVYETQLDAMRARISTLETELAMERQAAPSVSIDKPRIIADSQDLIAITNQVTVVSSAPVPSAKELAYQAQIEAMEARTESLSRELAKKRAAARAAKVKPDVSTVPPPARTGMLPMMTLISVDRPPPAADTEAARSVPPATAPKVLPPAETTPKAPPTSTPTDTSKSQSQIQTQPGSGFESVDEIATAWGESKVEAPETESWWTRTFGSRSKSPEPASESRTVAAPVIVAAASAVAPASEREKEFEKRIASLESHIAELNARLAQQQSETSTAAPLVSVSVPATKVVDGKGLAVPVKPVPVASPKPNLPTVIADSAMLATNSTTVVKSSNLTTATPEIVTAKEREYRPGFFQRMFTKGEPEAATVAVASLATNAAVTTIDETVVAETVTASNTVVTKVESAVKQPVVIDAKPEVVTATEREYRPGFFQRMFTKGEPEAATVAVASAKTNTAVTTINEPVVAETVTASNTVVTKVENAVKQPVVIDAKPEVVTATEREYRPGFFQKMFAKGDRRAAGTPAAVESEAPEVKESPAVKVVSQSPAKEAKAKKEPAAKTAKSEPAVEVTEVVGSSTVVKETPAGKVIADSDTLVTKDSVEKTTKVVKVEVEEVEKTIVAASQSPKEEEPRIEEVFVERKKPETKPAKAVAAEKKADTEAKPTVVEVVERDQQPGFFKRVISRISGSEGKDEKAAVTASTSTTSTAKPEPAVTVATAPPPMPTEVAVQEREYRPGFFQRLFSRTDAGESTAVKVVSSSRSEVAAKTDTKNEAERETAVVSVTTVPAGKEVADNELKQADAGSRKTGGFDAKLASLEERLTSMRGELVETRKERDDLKRQVGGGVTDSAVAVPAPVRGAEIAKDNSPTTGPGDENIEPALNRAYGEKISLLESNLISLSEELANARVERARLREELAVARKAASSPAPAAVGSVPVAPVLPDSVAAGITVPPTGVAGTVIADSAALAAGENAGDIPQPEWLKQEVRSVIATADPWAQPPGATVAAGDSGVPVAKPAVNNPTANSIVELPPTPPVAGEKAAESTVAKRRKPGFFTRLFGRGREDDEERRIPATNVVVVPPTIGATGPVTGAPSDAQLLGNDSSFAGGASQTNFPRVAYTPDATASFFTPGVGNVTQLPGFPRQQPVMTPPPTRAMDPTKVSSAAGLTTVETRTTAGGATKTDAGVTTVGDLSTTKPMVAIISPPDGATLPTPVLDLRGLAQGERRIAQVLVSLDGGPFQPAAGLERWSFQSPVTGGEVLVRVKAVDATGRESEVLSRTFRHRATSRVTVAIAGQGRVEPDLNGRELVIGEPYEVAALPAAGYEFVGWSGGAASADPRLMFQMNKDLYLRAEFRPIAAGSAAPVAVAAPATGPVAPSRMRGFYTGLLYPQERMQADRSGYFDLQVEDDGSFTGQIRLATSAAPLRGRFDADGRGTQTIDRPGAPPITIRFTRQDEGSQVTGFFDADGVPIVMRAYRAVADGDTLTAIVPGRYTLVIPGPPDAARTASPAGDGFGEVRIDAGGHVKFSGELPDGTKVIQETRISAGGVWPLYVPLYQGGGLLTGWISVTNHPTLDLYGDLRWIKPAVASDRYYPQGFASRRFVFGSIYQPSHDRLDKRKGLSGVLLGGNLGSLALGQDPADLPATSPERQTLQQFDYEVDPESGRMQGTFVHPETRQPTRFHGMFVQKRGWKSGYFMGADSSGVVYLNEK